jgi:carbonic anhydrase
MVASLEYAVQVLKTPLIMVLGHEACGAVDATKCHGPMSAIGTKRTSIGHPPMSAFGGKADIGCMLLNVRF